MKNIHYLISLLFVLALTSCANKSKFPVSNVVPAADIVAKKSTDNNDNYTLEITAENLASPERLDPAGNNYSVWINTVDNGIKNMGQILTKNAKKATFKAVTPYDFDEVFITVEDEGNLKLPQGREISRTKF